MTLAVLKQQQEKGLNGVIAQLVELCMTSILRLHFRPLSLLIIPAKIIHRAFLLLLLK